MGLPGYTPRRSGAVSATTLAALKTTLLLLPVETRGDLRNKTTGTRILTLEITVVGATVALSTYVVRGPIRFDRVTDSQYGEIASGSGTAYVLVAGHSMPASGTLRPWDVSAGSEAGADVAFTVVGDALTLAASRTMAAGDLTYTTGVSELTIGSADDVQPKANAVLLFSSGLSHTGGDGIILQPAVDAARPNPVSSVGATCVVAVAAPGAGSVFAAGISLGGSTSVSAHGMVNDAGTWKRARVSGVLPGYSVTPGNVTGTPTTGDSVQCSVAHMSQADPSSASTYAASTAGPGVTSAAGKYGGTGGTLSGAVLMCRTVGGGSLSVVWSELYMRGLSA